MNIAIIAIVVVAAAVIGFYIRRSGLKRERERLRLSVAELNERIKRKEKLTILDLRHPLDVLAAPQLIPAAIPVSPRDVKKCADEIPRDAQIVLYCTCPNEETSLNAYRQMKNCGFSHVKVLTGGLPAWKRANLPLQDLYPELEQQLRKRATQS